MISVPTNVQYFAFLQLITFQECAPSWRKDVYTPSAPPPFLASSSAVVYPSCPLPEVPEKGAQENIHVSTGTAGRFGHLWGSAHVGQHTQIAGRPFTWSLRFPPLREGHVLMWRMLGWEVGTKLLESCDIAGGRRHKKSGREGNRLGIVAVEE